MSEHSSHRICVLPGDGAGVDVTEAALPVLKALAIPCELQFADIGWQCWLSEGNPVPESTWQRIEHADVVLLGAITSKPLREAEEALPPALRGRDHA